MPSGREPDLIRVTIVFESGSILWSRSRIVSVTQSELPAAATEPPWPPSAIFASGADEDESGCEHGRAAM
jgi:hypothetical protein